MIVDDESDHATINTMIPKANNIQEQELLDDWYDDYEDEEEEEEELDATVINRRLVFAFSQGNIRWLRDPVC